MEIFKSRSMFLIKPNVIFGFLKVLQTFNFFMFLGKPVMIVIEYMENGALDSFLRVSSTHIMFENECFEFHKYAWDICLHLPLLQLY